MPPAAETLMENDAPWVFLQIRIFFFLSYVTHMVHKPTDKDRRDCSSVPAAKGKRHKTGFAFCSSGYISFIKP